MHYRGCPKGNHAILLCFVPGRDEAYAASVLLLPRPSYLSRRAAPGQRARWSFTVSSGGLCSGTNWSVSAASVPQYHCLVQRSGRRKNLTRQIPHRRSKSGISRLRSFRLLYALGQFPRNPNADTNANSADFVDFFNKFRVVPWAVSCFSCKDKNFPKNGTFRMLLIRLYFTTFLHDNQALFS